MAVFIQGYPDRPGSRVWDLPPGGLFCLGIYADDAVEIPISNPDESLIVYDVVAVSAADLALVLVDLIDTVLVGTGIETKDIRGGIVKPFSHPNLLDWIDGSASQVRSFGHFPINDIDWFVGQIDASEEDGAISPPYLT